MKKEIRFTQFHGYPESWKKEVSEQFSFSLSHPMTSSDPSSPVSSRGGTSERTNYTSGPRHLVVVGETGRVLYSHRPGRILSPLPLLS